jgi:hypothetical protein
METSGGGGLGDPLERNPALVADDVRLGYTSTDVARETYGVALDGDGGVDVNATRRLRDTIRRERINVEIVATDADLYDGARRIFAIGRGAARALRVADGELCEIVNPRGPNLRGWVRIENAESRNGVLPLGPFGREILRCNQRDHYQLRVLRGRNA